MMADGGPQKLPAAILLDVGGTLLREERNDLAGGLRTFLESSDLPGGVMAPGEIESCVSDLLSIVEATRMIGDREFVLEEWIRTRLAMPPADAAVAELAIWTTTVDLVPIEGAQAVLEAAAGRGIRLAVLSNAMFSGRAIAFELQRQGFDLPLRFVMSSADRGLRKPSAELFRHALSSLEVDSSEAWYIGDSWDCDIVGAAGVGMRAIWLGGGDPPDATLPHRVVSTWMDIGALLEACRSSGSR